MQLRPNIFSNKWLFNFSKNSLFDLEKLIIGPIKGVQMTIFHSISDSSPGATPISNQRVFFLYFSFSDIVVAAISQGDHTRFGSILKGHPEP